MKHKGLAEEANHNLYNQPNHSSEPAACLVELAPNIRTLCLLADGL